MTFPTTAINTANLDSATDDPSLARADLLDAVQKLNTIITEAGDPSGVVVLDGAGFVAQSQIPPTLSPSGDVALVPSTNIVSMQYILRMTPQTVSTIINLTGNIAGDMILCSNVGNVVSNPGLAFYTTSGWRTLAFSANTFANI